MVGRKTFLAVGIAVLAIVPVALADNPTVRIATADQAKAVASLLRLSDFGAGWTGGKTSPSKLTAPSCPGFNPKESDLVVTGHADARFTYAKAAITFDQDTQVLENAQAVRTDFSRTIRPQLPACLAYEIKHSSKEPVTSIAVHKLSGTAFGDVSAVYRATITFRVKGNLVKWVSDSIFIGKGRYEYSVSVFAPAPELSQLAPFEQAMIKVLLTRAARSGNVA